jgi:CelD/BcsL family acetyltransferase involved in cellulose biosynthesis
MRIVTDSFEWRAVLREIPRYDFYHTWDYHAQATKDGSGRAMMLVHDNGGALVALPLIVRSGSINGYEFKDATSVYGYSGPVVADPNATGNHSDFGSALTETLDDMGVVSVFSRLHPLLGNDRVVDGLGVIEYCGNTVSIDLTRSDDEHWSQYSTNHRRGIRKCRRLGVECAMSGVAADLDEFERIYTESMHRVDASEQYFFDSAFFEGLLDSNDYAMRLFVCRWEDKVICGGLFSSCNGVVQYHLGGTRSEFLKLAPSKMMFDAVRSWAKSTGHTVFHLGGGLGGGDDSLYRIKKGFSASENRFMLWKWILDDDLYQTLTRLHWEAAGARRPGTFYEGFFPAYRHPPHGQAH